MVPMRSTRRWSSTPHEDRPATAALASPTGPAGVRAPAPRRLLPSAAWATRRCGSERRVIAYAHQGGAWEAPSSTLHAIDHALEVGRDGMELDVHATADGELVVCHDATVDRTTAAQGTIAVVHAGRAARHGLLVLVDPRRRRHAGAPRGRLSRSAAGPRPTRPSASPPCARSSSGSPGVVLNLDIKQTAPVVAPYEESLARLLAEFGRTDDVIVASFLDPATDAFRPQHRSADLGRRPWRRPRPGGRCRPARHLPDEPGRWPSRCPNARATWWWSTSASWRRPTAPARRSTCGRSTTPSPWSACSDLGVDGIISDVPDHAVRRAGAAGVAWNGP